MKINFFVTNVCILAVILCFLGCKDDDDNGTEEVLVPSVTLGAPADNALIDLETVSGNVSFSWAVSNGAINGGYTLVLSASQNLSSPQTFTSNATSINISVSDMDNAVGALGGAKGVEMDIYWSVKPTVEQSFNAPAVRLLKIKRIEETQPDPDPGLVSPTANAYIDLANVTGGNVLFEWMPGDDQYYVILSETADGAAVHTFGPFTGATASIAANDINDELFPEIDLGYMDDIAPQNWVSSTDYPEAKKFWRTDQLSDLVKDFYWNISVDGTTVANNGSKITFVKNLPPTYIGVSNCSATSSGSGLFSTPRNNIHTIVTLTEPDKMVMKIDMIPDQLAASGAVFGWAQSTFIFGEVTKLDDFYWQGNLSFVGLNQTSEVSGQVEPIAIIKYNNVAQAVELTFEGNSASILFRWVGPHDGTEQLYHALVDFTGEKINFRE